MDVERAAGVAGVLVAAHQASPDIAGSVAARCRWVEAGRREEEGAMPGVVEGRVGVRWAKRRAAAAEGESLEGHATGDGSGEVEE